MKAAQFYEYGEPSVLQYEDVDTPEPGPSEVRVRVAACGVNHFDIDVRAGVSRWPMPFPHRLGAEVAGDVDAVGSDVSGHAIGDAVWVQFAIACGTCHYCRIGKAHLCPAEVMFGLQRPGGYADYVIAPAEAVHRLPSGLSYDQAAAGQAVFTTAYHMIVSRGQLQMGETMVVQAGASGVGHAAVQIGVLAGARVIATAGSDDKLTYARELGASDVINYNRDNISNRVFEMTDGEGADLYIDHVGGKHFMGSVRALKKDGRLVTCGAHAGETPALDVVELFRNEYRIIGSRIGTPEENRRVMDLLAEGKLRAHIHAKVALAEVGEAHRIVEAREHTGKVLLVP